MIEYLAQLDTQAFLAVNGFHTDFLDPVMRMLTGRWLWAGLYAAIIYVVIRRFGLWRGLLLVAVMCLAVGVSDMICAHVVRPYVCRLRPANLNSPIVELTHIVNGYRAGGYSFPSCHACNTVALALSSSIVLRDRAYTLFIFLWAALQCYTRLYLGVHYPGDILAGAAVGAAIACAACLPVRKMVAEPANPGQRAWAAIAVGVVTILAVIPLSWT